METAEHVVSTVLSKDCDAKSPQEATVVGVPGQEAMSNAEHRVSVYSHTCKV